MKRSIEAAVPQDRLEPRGNRGGWLRGRGKLGPMAPMLQAPPEEPNCVMQEGNGTLYNVDGRDLAICIRYLYRRWRFHGRGQAASPTCGSRLYSPDTLPSPDLESRWLFLSTAI